MFTVPSCLHFLIFLLTPLTFSRYCYHHSLAYAPNPFFLSPKHTPGETHATLPKSHLLHHSEPSSKQLDLVGEKEATVLTGFLRMRDDQARWAFLRATLPVTLPHFPSHWFIFLPGVILRKSDRRTKRLCYNDSGLLLTLR